MARLTTPPLRFNMSPVWLSRRFLLIALAGVLSPAVAVHSEDSLRASIDRHISNTWKSNQLTPAEQSADAEFLRRVYLDLVGTIPTYDAAVTFLDDNSPDK
ncbi:MAG: DUF1549 domain-containing protein, partial [Pirellulaceae bacterium]